MTASVSGMGAIPLRTGGVAFRVWAQHARNVHVAGEFNGWSKYTNRLDPEGNGNCPTDAGDPDHMPCRGSVSLAPYSVLILSQ